MSFSFGNAGQTAPAAGAAPAGGFSFGSAPAAAAPVSKPAAPAGGFSFGSAPPAEAAESKPAAAAGGFSFGSAPAAAAAESKPAAAAGGFSFGSAAATSAAESKPTAGAAPAGGLGFGSGVKLGAAATGAAGAAGAAGALAATPGQAAAPAAAAAQAIAPSKPVAYPAENTKVDEIIKKMREELASEEKVFSLKADLVAANDVVLFNDFKMCNAVVNDLKRLEVDQREELDCKLNEAEERQNKLDSELNEVEKEVDKLLKQGAGAQGLQTQDYERATMLALSKELQGSMDEMLDQLRSLVDTMNGDYEHQLGREANHTKVMGMLNTHHQMIQWLNTNTREMEREIAELEARF